MDPAKRQSGQAAVELVAVLPVVMLVAGLLWQVVLTGQGLWLCANAARVAARASVVGGDAEEAARSALPDVLEKGMRVATGDDGVVEVLLRVPLLSPSLDAAIPVRSAARLGAAG
jgi:pilus assembly protein CpaE